MSRDARPWAYGGVRWCPVASRCWPWLTRSTHALGFAAGHASTTISGTGSGRPGDQGVIAKDPGGGLLAAAWFRHYSADEPGYGFLVDDVPEVSIAVRRPWRDHGLGGRMLDQLEAVAGRSGIRALSLSAQTLNPAARLYRRRDYEETARADGASTMRLVLGRR